MVKFCVLWCLFRCGLVYMWCGVLVGLFVGVILMMVLIYCSGLCVVSCRLVCWLLSISRCCMGGGVVWVVDVMKFGLCGDIEFVVLMMMVLLCMVVWVVGGRWLFI